ncbi:MAG: hypothetical protein JW782_01335 [Candidatus Saganbacteria bacterium]|nr:hypothetical protein [Candidatus Saganbacteria bacterium]
MHRISPAFDLFLRGLGYLYDARHERLTGLKPFSQTLAKDLLLNGHRRNTLILSRIRQLGYQDIASALTGFNIRAIDLNLYVRSVHYDRADAEQALAKGLRALIRHLTSHHPLKGQSLGKTVFKLAPLLYLDCYIILKVKTPARPDVNFELKIRDLR